MTFLDVSDDEPPTIEAVADARNTITRILAYLDRHGDKHPPSVVERYNRELDAAAQVMALFPARAVQDRHPGRAPFEEHIDGTEVLGVIAQLDA